MEEKQGPTTEPFGTRKTKGIKYTLHKNLFFPLHQNSK